MSESLRNNTFRIYLSEKSEVNCLVIKVLVLRDFSSTVPLYLFIKQYANTILLTMKGGSELLLWVVKQYLKGLLWEVYDKSALSMVSVYHNREFDRYYLKCRPLEMNEDLCYPLYICKRWWVCRSSRTAWLMVRVF